MKETMSKGKGLCIILALILILAGCSYVTCYGVGKNHAGAAKNITLGLDLAGGVSITYQTVGDSTPSEEAMKDTIYKIQQRIEANYSSESSVYKEGINRISIEIPGQKDDGAVLEELGKPGMLYFLRHTNEDGTPNYSTTMLTDEEGNIMVDEAGMPVYATVVTNQALAELLASGDNEKILASPEIVLTGTDVASAQTRRTQDDYGNQQFVVSLSLNADGTKKFEEATTVAFNNGHESIAIYYDGKIVSAPSVNAVIVDGSAIIEGNFTAKSAEELASTIRIGGLSLTLEPIRSSVVSASLGSAAIDTSLKAGAIGLLIVIIFMIVVYWIPGLVAGISLLFYTVLELIILEQFSVTLTLPGIAGIILSIGMAVDANVIIYARVREEIAAGKTVRSALSIGFKKATSAIVDGNITTLIAAAVLGFLGTGTIKGFAITLAIGIALSLLTSLGISRWLAYSFYALGFKSEKFYGRAKELKPINFLAKRKLFFSISSLMIVVGIVAMVVFGAKTGDPLNYGLEFKGGTSTTVQMPEDQSIETLNATVKVDVEEIVGSAAQITKTEGSTEIIVKTNNLSTDQTEKLDELFTTKYNVTEQIQRETISATVSNEMRADAIIAVVVSAICMLLYIWFRFKDVRFASSAVCALLHDVLVVLTFYALVRVSVGNTFIACMLTIVGYSINATIVIFDRIRENMPGHKTEEEIEEVVNNSITQTLTRSIYTSFTTLVMVLVLYILGVTAIREFALPLMVGIICGAYSSVCITGALWFIMRKGGKKKAE